MSAPKLNDLGIIERIDQGKMRLFLMNAQSYYQQASKLAETFEIGDLEFSNVVISGMGGSGIGGELVKDWLRNRASFSVEVNREYSLPSYVHEKTLVVIVSYSGDTEETVASFDFAIRKGCSVCCVTSGGSLLERARKLGVPYLRVPSGFPPRAALPYLMMPILHLLARLGKIDNLSEEVAETLEVIGKICKENNPQKPQRENFSKKLANGINGTVPAIYGFGVFRGAALRFKQQLNENSKVPSKWDFFSELNHNEIVGWENAGRLGRNFSAVFIRDRYEPIETTTRIMTTKKLIETKVANVFELWSQGESDLARMLSAVLIGDFVSFYLAILRETDPTPVKTISLLKETLRKSAYNQGC